jgi:hypothetical protein
MSRGEAAAAEPDVRIPGGADPVASFPGEGYVVPVVLIGRLLGEAVCPPAFEDVHVAGRCRH